jgi:hypothetical protein
MKTLNINIIDIISLAEDSLRGIFEDKLSAKNSVFQARCKAAVREGKDLSSFHEGFGTEEEAEEISLLNLALEFAISDKWLTHNQYLEWLHENNLEDSEENYIFFNSVKKTVNEIVDCLRCPSLIEKKTGFEEKAVKMLQYITTGGINHKAPAFVIE